MTDLNASQGQQLRRVLKPRHLNMIATAALPTPLLCCPRGA
ncbi:hypothetical protein, partial [Pseudomonas aeruginosa]